jgi:DNA adenine methylase
VMRETSWGRSIKNRTLLRWAGSKRMLIPILRPLVPRDIGRYIEPFAGSASLFFALQPQAAVLGDTNTALVEFLHEVQKNPETVYSKARAIPEGSASYYKVRAASTERMSATSKAARFYYLNRFCFNGIYRTNEQGVFNVPHSGSRSGVFPTIEEFLSLVQILRKARVVDSDFEVTVRKFARPNDFVYLDPPYAVRARRIFRQYGKHSFAVDDLNRLTVLLREMDSKGVRFMLSYAYCAEAIEAFRAWSQQKLFAQRNISGFVKSRRLAAELLVTNFEIDRLAA